MVKFTLSHTVKIKIIILFLNSSVLREAYILYSKNHFRMLQSDDASKNDKKHLLNVQS